MKNTSEIVLAAALLSAAFSSGALLACTDGASADGTRNTGTSAAGAPDSSDPEALKRAADVVAAWQKRDPSLTAAVLAQHGILVADAATYQAMAGDAAHGHQLSPMSDGRVDAAAHPAARSSSAGPPPPLA